MRNFISLNLMQRDIYWYQKVISAVNDESYNDI